MDPKERNALGRSGIVLVAAIINGVTFGFDLIAGMLFAGSLVIFLVQYLPARRRRLTDAVRTYED